MTCSTAYGADYAEPGLRAAQSRIEEEQVMQDSTKYIGLDVDRDTITVAVGDPGAAPPRLWGAIENEPRAVDKMIQQLSP